MDRLTKMPATRKNNGILIGNVNSKI